MNFEELAASLKSGSGMQRAQSAQDLGKLRDRRAIRPLMVALGDKSSAVRNNAAFALAELGASEAVPGIIPLLRDPEEWVRKSAAKSLGLLRAGSAVDDLISQVIVSPFSPAAFAPVGKSQRPATAAMAKLQIDDFKVFLTEHPPRLKSLLTRPGLLCVIVK